jgi:hypothetical protein
LDRRLPEGGEQILPEGGEQILPEGGEQMMSAGEQAWWRVLWMMVGHGVDWNTARGFMVPIEQIREMEKAAVAALKRTEYK